MQVDFLAISPTIVTTNSLKLSLTVQPVSVTYSPCVKFALASGDTVTVPSVHTRIGTGPIPPFKLFPNIDVTWSALPVVTFGVDIRSALPPVMLDAFKDIGFWAYIALVSSSSSFPLVKSELSVIFRPVPVVNFCTSTLRAAVSPLPCTLTPSIRVPMRISPSLLILKCFFVPLGPRISRRSPEFPYSCSICKLDAFAAIRCAPNIFPSTMETFSTLTPDGLLDSTFIFFEEIISLPLKTSCVSNRVFNTFDPSPKTSVACSPVSNFAKDPVTGSVPCWISNALDSLLFKWIDVGRDSILITPEPILISLI